LVDYSDLKQECNSTLYVGLGRLLYFEARYILSTLYIIFMYEMVIQIINHEFLVMQCIYILQFVSCGIHVHTVFPYVRKNLPYWGDLRPSKPNNCIYWNIIFNPCRISLPTHTADAWNMLLFCNACLIGYQRTYMRCIIYLQHPKTQRILSVGKVACNAQMGILIHINALL
jgi:hypothetical protein